MYSAVVVVICRDSGRGGSSIESSSGRSSSDSGSSIRSSSRSGRYTASEVITAV